MFNNQKITFVFLLNTIFTKVLQYSINALHLLRILPAQFVWGSL